MNSDNFKENIDITQEVSQDFSESKLPGEKGRLIRAVMILVFIMTIFGAVGFHLLEPDKSFSESENRVLAEMPPLSFSSVADGSFMKAFETYLTDQFPFRDKIIALKTFTDRAVGKTEENGVYIGHDGFLFEKQSEYDAERVKALTKAITAFAKKNKRLKTAFLLAPNSSYIYSQQLPDFLYEENQKHQIAKIYNKVEAGGVTLIRACKALEKASEKSADLLYYKTDHHWTTRGAKVAFDEIISTWKLKSDKKPVYEFHTVSESFQGTLSSTAGIHSFSDRVEICVPEKSEGTYVVNFESQNNKTASLFFSEKLQQKNQYEVFLGGNYDKVIVSTVCQSDNALLLIKDSYANAMISMLTPYFNKIVIIDPRYLTDSLESIIKEHELTHCLFLYNLNTFLEDTSLEACLKS